MPTIKVFIPNDSRESIGGGWSFRRNLIKYAPFRIVEDLESSDAVLISSITMITKDRFKSIREAEKPVILRIDGIPEPWRNPRINVGKRMKEWARMADFVVFQSEFTKDTIGSYFGIDGRVILNGVDPDIFNAKGKKQNQDYHAILHIMLRQDPNKRPEEVFYMYRMLWRERQDTILVLVGDYPNHFTDHNFGFMMGERYIRISKVQPHRLAEIMRGCQEFWFPSFADPCPNTLIEALMCGCEPKFVNRFSGAWEIVENWKHGYDFTAERMAKEYDAILKEAVKLKGLSHV